MCTVEKNYMKTGGFVRSFSNQQIQSSRSVYGGAGGSDVRISTCYLPKSSSNVWDLGVGLYFNEKTTMQNLNDRLATYLEKVRTLEKANSELEVKIKEWYSQRIIISQDYAHYKSTIDDLYRKISFSKKTNMGIELDTENARLAAEDFRMKYESELAIHQIIMADNVSWKTQLDHLTLIRSDLELRAENMKTELAIMKKDHQEEMALLRTEVQRGLIKVEVDMGPRDDLGRILEEMRAEYEARILKISKEMELWYQQKITELNPGNFNWSEELDRLRSELIEGRRSKQKMEIELKSFFSMRAALEISLQELHSRFNYQLSELQSIIAVLESDTSQVRIDTQRQHTEYMMLLDIKTKLELEIAEYRRLLDGGNQQVIIQTEVKHQEITKRVRTIEEVIVDGKVVSREEDVDVEKLS